MEWTNLLATQKLAQEETEPTTFARYPINDFEKDYNKIVSSAAFRRLQDKTQVFPLDKSDFVRTRLTHSIEVSTIARQLGIMLTQNTTPYRPDDIGENEAENIPSILLCAGLLHDLGNPPFGHFGETTIGEWFKENLDKVSYKGRTLRQCLTPQMVKDLENFEGNAQALRILLKARFNSEVNLSAAVISTLVKYPNDSLHFDGESPDIKKHKLGYYVAEEQTFGEVVQVVGTTNTNGEICRHPLTYLLEAADDIAYATADLEDAFKKKLFTLDQFIAFYNGAYNHGNVVRHGSPEFYTEELLRDLVERRGISPTSEGDSKAFKDWLNYTRRWLMFVAVYRFSASYRDITAGTFEHDLFYDTNHSVTIKVLKKAMGKFVFNTSSILKLELSAQSILSFLLDKFIRAVLYFDYADEDQGFVQSKADKKYIAIFSENYIQDYHSAKTGDEEFDLYLRLLMVTDYISGMTDSYARTLYRELSGIE